MGCLAHLIALHGLVVSGEDRPNDGGSAEHLAALAKALKRCPLKYGRLLCDAGLLRLCLHLSCSGLSLRAAKALLRVVQSLFPTHAQHCVASASAAIAVVTAVLAKYADSSEVVFLSSRVVVALAPLGMPAPAVALLAGKLLVALRSDMTSRAMQWALSAILCLLQLEAYSHRRRADAFVRVVFGLFRAHERRTYLPKLICEALLAHTCCFSLNDALALMLGQILEHHAADEEMCVLGFAAVRACALLAPSFATHFSLSADDSFRLTSQAMAEYQHSPVALFHVLSFALLVFEPDLPSLGHHLLDALGSVSVAHPTVMLQTWTPLLMRMQTLRGSAVLEKDVSSRLIPDKFSATF